MTGSPALLVIAGGSRKTASARHRLWNYRAWLERDFPPLGWVEYRGGEGGGSWAARRERVSFLLRCVRGARGADIVLIQKLLFPGPVLKAWRSGGKRLVYDFDDALYAQAPTGESRSRAEARRRRLDTTLRLVDHVMVGSEPLRRYALERNPSVDLVYPSLDADRFQGIGSARPETEPGFRVGWIGGAASLPYLEGLEDTLTAVSAEVDGFELVVCSARPPDLSPALSERVRFVPWSEDNELAVLGAIDCAVSPMGRDPWSQGRGGRVSVLNYMAAAVPIVVMRGGGIEDLVAHGESAFFADGPSDFGAHLLWIAGNPDRARELGRAGRAVIEARIWAEVQYPRLRGGLRGDPPGGSP